jgi:hypothetical protein
MPVHEEYLLTLSESEETIPDHRGVKNCPGIWTNPSGSHGGQRLHHVMHLQRVHGSSGTWWSLTAEPLMIVTHCQ